METTEKRLRELIIEELQAVLQEKQPKKVQKALDLVTNSSWRTLGEKHPLFPIFSSAEDQDLNKVLGLYGSTGLAEEEVNEIARKTEFGKGGFSGVYQYAKEGMEFLDSLAGKFGDRDVPEELEQAAQRFEYILGASKIAIARNVAPTWAYSNPKEIERLHKKHLVSQFENKENK
jgi:hypothetical protein